MSYELPQSAIKILRSSYLDIVSDQTLTHNQRRKLWKSRKRRKKRIMNYFARKFLASEASAESDVSDDNDTEYDLPKGPLTNSAIINYFRSCQDNETPSDQVSVQGILKNHKEPSTRNIELGTGLALPNASSPFVSSDKRLSLTDRCSSDHGAENEDAMESVGVVVQSVPDSDAESHTAEEKSEITDLLAQLDEEVERWQNPSPPPDVDEVGITENITFPSQVNVLDQYEDNRPLCTFYSKTGACRFGDKCSKKHPTVDCSNTLLFMNMFQPFFFGLEDRIRVTGDYHDLSLEHSEQDLNEEFLDFYKDIEPEFSRIGEVSQLFVCCNRGHHLRGNVYVQYFSIDDAKKCHELMFGRYFGGKRIYCQYVNIVAWSETLCGIDAKHGMCSRGGQCNYLHCFKLPNSYTRDRYNEMTKGRNHRHNDKRRRSGSNRYRNHHHRTLRRQSFSRSSSSDYESYYHSSSHKKKKRRRRSPSRSPKTVSRSLQHKVSERQKILSTSDNCKEHCEIKCTSSGSKSPPASKFSSTVENSSEAATANGSNSKAKKQSSRKKKSKKSKSEKKKRKKHKSEVLLVD